MEKNSIMRLPGTRFGQCRVKEVTGALQFGVPQTLVTNWSTPDPFFQVSPDGKKILLYRVSQQVGDALTVVSNFASALKK